MNSYMVKEIIKKIREKAFLFITMAMILCLGTMAMAAQSEQTNEVYYEAVIVHSGDTLWGIAKKYKDDNENTERMIYKIMRINGLRSENIVSGKSLIVPIKR